MVLHSWRRCLSDHVEERLHSLKILDLCQEETHDGIDWTCLFPNFCEGALSWTLDTWIDMNLMRLMAADLYKVLNGPSVMQVAASGKSVEMENFFSRLTLDIIGKAVFNYDFDSLTHDDPVIQV